MPIGDPAFAYNAQVNAPGLEVFNNQIPKEGNRVLPLSFNFSSLQNNTVDLTSNQQTGKLSLVQSVFVDNSQNTATMTITCWGTNQVLYIPAGFQAILPVYVANPPKFAVFSSGNGISTVFFCNFPQYTYMWDTTP